MQQFKLLMINPVMTPYLPSRDDMNVWHVSFRGPENSCFASGIYHVEINLQKWPLGPPEI